MDLQVIKHYKTNCPGITKVMTGSDNSVWLCNNKSKTIEHVLPSGDVLERISSLNMWFIDVAIVSTGDLLFSTEETNLKVIPTGTNTVKQAPNFRVPEGKIVTIHVNDDKKRIIVAVCMKEYNESGQVIVMDEEGKPEARYQVFETPGSIASTRNMMIGVVDLANRHFKDGSGHVVFIDHYQMKVTNIYKGHTATFRNGYHPFRPYDIVATTSNNFIVSDICLNNPVLHILDPDGYFITYCNTREELEICLPFTLAIDKDGLLYIGSQTFKGDPYASLHTIQIYES